MIKPIWLNINIWKMWIKVYSRFFVIFLQFFSKSETIIESKGFVFVFKEWACTSSALISSLFPLAGREPWREAACTVGGGAALPAPGGLCYVRGKLSSNLLSYLHWVGELFVIATCPASNSSRLEDGKAGGRWSLRSLLHWFSYSCLRHGRWGNGESW